MLLDEKQGLIENPKLSGFVQGVKFTLMMIGDDDDDVMHLGFEWDSLLAHDPESPMAY